MDALPPIRPEVSWDATKRVEDMDRGQVDVSVLYPTHVSSYCALRDVASRTRCTARTIAGSRRFCGRRRADSSGQSWPTCATCRRRGRGEALGGARSESRRRLHLPQAPGGKLLDNPDLYPLYEVAQELDLPLLAHGGTSRPPYGPGSFDLDGAWFLLHSFANPWAGMAALGALVGGGIFEMFPRFAWASSRPAVAGCRSRWIASIRTTSCHRSMCTNLKRLPREVLAEGRYFHAIDTWERSIEFCVQELGEDLWLFATDWPHGDTAWPDERRSDRESAGADRSAPSGRSCPRTRLRLCPRLAPSSGAGHGPPMLIRGGHVLDPAQGIDAVRDVRLDGGRVRRRGE
jgi:hypothetical protein